MIIHRKFAAMCILFTILTVMGSMRNLFLDFEPSMDSEILSRMLLSVFLVMSLKVFEWLNEKSLLFKLNVHFIVGLVLVLLYAGLTQSIGFLAEERYDNAALNYLFAYMFFILVCIARRKKGRFE